MNVVDTSALVVVLNREAESGAIGGVLATSRKSCISAACVVEATSVAQRWGDRVPMTALDDLLREMRIEIVALDLSQMQIARDAYMKFGKGRGHPAQLNICDCFSYALAKSLDAPLLFKGDDFVHTDLRIAS